jgi:hypothetical protein
MKGRDDSFEPCTEPLGSENCEAKALACNNTIFKLLCFEDHDRVLRHPDEDVTSLQSLKASSECIRR